MLGYALIAIGAVIAVAGAITLQIEKDRPKSAEAQPAVAAPNADTPKMGKPMMAVRFKQLETADEGKQGEVRVSLLQQGLRAEGRFIVKDGTLVILTNDAEIQRIADTPRAEGEDLGWNYQFDGDPIQNIVIWGKAKADASGYAK